LKCCTDNFLRRAKLYRSRHGRPFKGVPVVVSLELSELSEEDETYF
jgi:hypothetical protein